MNVQPVSRLCYMRIVPKCTYSISEVALPIFFSLMTSFIWTIEPWKEIEVAWQFSSWLLSKSFISFSFENEPSLIFYFILSIVVLFDRAFEVKSWNIETKLLHTKVFLNASNFYSLSLKDLSFRRNEISETPSVSCTLEYSAYFSFSIWNLTYLFEYCA